MNEAQTSQEIPLELARLLLRDHLNDSTATLTDLDAEPITTVGVSGNNFYGAQVAWKGQGKGGAGRAGWIIKHWQPGGHNEAVLGLTRPVEALAWQYGLLPGAPAHNRSGFPMPTDSREKSRSVLRKGTVSPSDSPPEGIIVPFIGVHLDPDEHEAWIVMEDIAEELGAYSRAHPLPLEEATVRVKYVLEHLARFHAYWELPRQQTKLRDAAWLLPLEDALWKDAATYAIALDEAPKGGRAKGGPVDDALRANLRTFLDWLPAPDRTLWQELICDRSALVAACQVLPQTLLHGDLDDRNIGLRWSNATEEAPDLILIDWEWMGAGPPALDIAKILHQFYVICLPPPTLLDTYFDLLDELSAFYLERYVAAGGQTKDPALWRRSLGLGLIREHLTPLPHVIGNLVLAAQAETSSHIIPGMVIDKTGPIMPFLERTIAYATEEIRRWL